MAPSSVKKECLEIWIDCLECLESSDRYISIRKNKLNAWLDELDELDELDDELDEDIIFLPLEKSTTHSRRTQSKSLRLNFL
jgi:hypothetical protein